MTHFKILYFLSELLFVASFNHPSADVKTLIYAFQHTYCGGQFCVSDSSYKSPVCLENTTFPGPGNASASKTERCDPCTECSCDDPCSFLGNCCADKGIGEIYYVDCHEIVRYKKVETEVDSYVIVTKCLVDAPNYNQDVAWKCEYGEIGYIQDGRLVTAPHSYNTSVTFRNKYCAMCYGVTNYTFMDVYISCDDEFDTSNYSDINSMIRSVKESSSCVMSFDLPTDQMPRLCFPSHSMISECNVTGRWQEYNDSIKTACELYFRPTRTWEYRNIFCQLCNGETKEELECPSKCILDAYKPVSLRSFAALLNFDNSDAEIVTSRKSDYQIKRIGKQAADQCRNEDIYDIQSKVCREVYCPLAEDTTNVTCVTLVQSPQHVLTLWQVTAFYKGYIIVPMETTPTSLAQVVTEKLKNENVLGDCGFFVYSAKANDLARINSLTTLRVTESHLNLTLFLLSGFSLDISRGKLQDKLALNISWLGQTINVDIVSTRRNNTNKLQMSLFALHAGHPEMFNIRHTIDVPLVFNVSCSMVRFAINEIKTFNDSVIVHGYNILMENVYFVSETGDYFICLDVLSSKDLTIATPLIGESLIGPILTGICLSCSLHFLLITMLVYIFITDLHTVPGLNLIFLTSSLFVAQIFYLLGAGTVTTPTICTVIGVLIHYFWLVAFAWMNVCCFHMFRVFTNVFTALDFALHKKWLMLKYSVYAYGFAGLIVILTVVTTYVLSGYTNISYGGTTLCFVSPGLVSIISFGIPAGFAVSVNTVFLLNSALRLRNTSKTNRHLGRSEANDISKFFKLSTITGVPWIFGFIGYFLQTVELLYIFTILTAGQGVFIFLSFVTSRRILRMVKDKLCPRKRKGDRRKKFIHRGEYLDNSAGSATQETTIRL